jgi:hypothetical protein
MPSWGLTAFGSKGLRSVARRILCVVYTELGQVAEEETTGEPVHRSSYGQAAKVLDIAAKVYVYYCNMPSPEIAKALIPMLRGALDNNVVQHLIGKFPEVGVRSNNLEDIDRNKYEQLQSLVVKDVQGDFHSEIFPVQYDDIMFRRFNR